MKAISNTVFKGCLVLTWMFVLIPVFEDCSLTSMPQNRFPYKSCLRQNCHPPSTVAEFDWLSVTVRRNVLEVRGEGCFHPQLVHFFVVISWTVVDYVLSKLELLSLQTSMTVPLPVILFMPWSFGFAPEIGIACNYMFRWIEAQN